MVLKGVNWVHNDKLDKVVLKGVNWVHNTVTVTVRFFI